MRLLYSDCTQLVPFGILITFKFKLFSFFLYWHFAILQYVVMIIEIARHITDVSLSLQWVLDCLDSAVSQPVASTKVVHFLMFTHKKKQVGHMTFVGQPTSLLLGQVLTIFIFDVLTFYIYIYYTELISHLISFVQVFY